MIKPALYDMFRKLILTNELDNNPALALKFSDPDGVRSGKSGWSFGVSQFDLNNNPLAATCLTQCGFTAAEIAGLKSQAIDPAPLEAKLRANAAIVAQWDERQLAGCVNRAANIMEQHNIMIADDAAVLAIADYDNQYHLSNIDKPGYLLHYLAGLGRPARAEDVLDFKLTTPYGQKRPRDCHRRYENLMRICGA